jgi:phosphoglycolate phosphatase
LKPFLLFDFDGTIADSMHLGQKIANLIAPEFGHIAFSEEDFKRFRSLPMHKVIKELRIPFYKIPRVISRALIEYRHFLPELEPCEGIVGMLKTLFDMRIPVALLSSNTGENVQMFLSRHKIDNFMWVEGTSGILKKANRIKLQLKKHQLDAKNVIYIGDETRDIDAAHKCGLKVIAVTWGFHTADLLCSHNPDYLVEKPEEIVQIVKQLL